MYIFNGKKLTEEQAKKFAEETGRDLQTFLKANPDIQEDPDFGPQDELGKPEVAVEEVVPAVTEDTALQSEDGSLELLKNKYKTPLTRDEKISLQNNKFSKQMSKEDNFTKERLEELENKSEENVSVEKIIGKTVDGEKDESIWEQSSRAFLEGLENIDLQIASSDLMKEFESDEGVSEESAKALMVANANIKDNKELKSVKAYNDSFKVFSETGDNDFVALAKALYMNPEAGFPMAMGSMATVMSSIVVPSVAKEALGYGLASGGTAAATAALAGTLAGPAAPIVSSLGGVGGFLRFGYKGATFGAMKQLEKNLFFSEHLIGNIKGEITTDKIIKQFDNEDFIDELISKANARGLGVAAIETGLAFLPGKVGKKVMKSLAKKGGGGLATKIAAVGGSAVASGGVEMGVGMTGEVSGMLASGQELEVKDIVEEGIIGPYGKATSVKSFYNNVRVLQDEVAASNAIRETKYENAADAFTADASTEEAQITISSLKNGQEIVDYEVDKKVKKGEITLEQGNEIKKNFITTQGASNQIKPLRLSTEDQALAVRLMKEKKQLKDEIKQIGEPNLTIEQSDRVKEIDKGLKDVGSKAVTQEIEKVKKAAESIKDLDVQEFASTKETEAFLNEQGQDKKASGQQGFIIQNSKTGKQTIVINREIANLEMAVAAPTHEFLHALLFKTVSNSPETQLALGNSLKEYINSIDANKVKDSNFAKRLEQYKSDPSAVQAEEVLTLFSDAIRTEDIKFNEGVFTKIGDVIRKTLQALGVKVKFNNGKDVYNFIKDYNKSLDSTGLTKAQVKAAEGIKGKLVADKIQTDEQIIKDSRSEEASTKVQELYDTQGEAAAFDIIEQFKPITNKIVEKRSQAPGFDRQLLTDEVETGKRGILDLIKEYKPESGVPLAAYINKFLPARAIEASKRILGEEFTDDVTEAKGVAAEEIAVDVVSTDKQATSKLRRVLGIKQGDEIYDLAKEVSGEILSSDLPGKKVKTAVNKKARESKLRKAVSNLMGTEKAIDEQFLNKNILEVLKALPASDLVKLEREAKVKVLAEQGPRLNVKDAREAVNKGILPKDTNLQSGPKVSSKLPTTLEQAKEFFTQKRKAGLVNVVTEMLVKDAAPEVTEGKIEPAKRAKVLSEIDRAPTLKFSLSTKQDIAFEENENIDTGHVTFEGEFKVGDTQFGLKLIPLNDISDDFEAEFELKKQLEAKNIDTKELLSVEFEDYEGGGLDITGKSLEGKTSAIKTFSIVANSVLDFVKENNIKGVVFNSSESNRTRLYKAMVDRFSKELGWEYKQIKTTPVQGEVDTFIVTPKETTKEQSDLKFSKSVLDTLSVEFQKDLGIEGKVLNPNNQNDIDYYSEILTDVWSQWIPVEIMAAAGFASVNATDKAKVLKRGQYFTGDFFGDLTKIYKTKERQFTDRERKIVKAAVANKGFTQTKNGVLFLRDLGSAEYEQYVKDNFDGAKYIFLQFQEMMYSNPETIPSVAAFFNTASSSSNHLIRQIAVPRGVDADFLEFTKKKNKASKDYKEGKISEEEKKRIFKEYKTEKEHVWQQNQAGEYIFKMMADRNVETPGYFQFVRDNFYMLGLTAYNNNKLKDLKGTYGDPYDLGNGMTEEFNAALKEAVKTGDFSKVLPSLQRYFNSQVNNNGGGFNSNDLTFDGKPISEIYKVAVASNFRNTETQAFQNELIKEQLLGEKIDSQKEIDEFIGIAPLIEKAAISNNNALPVEVKFSKSAEYTNDNVLDRMAKIDNDSQESELKFSKSLDLDKDFNDIIENKTGIASDKTYARVKAEVAGANKGRFNFFIPPSAEDFVGLLYSTLGKGDVGDAQMAWYKAHLLNPFARAMENLANDRVSLMQDFKGLKKALKIVPKNLRKKIKDSDFTKEQAVRVAIWDKQGMTVPGLSQKDQQELVDYVNNDADLTVFADQLIAMGKGDAYAAPDGGWVAGTIDTDFIKALNTVKRDKYLEVWQQNADEIFSEANLNKLEAAYGKPYREAMENMLTRMSTGKNTSSGSDKLTARFTDWLTNSVGAIMFFNTRSAVLQTISAVNFINFSDNNVLKAGVAFANQPQYWKDFKKLFNSPFLLDRRSGLKLNVNEADIADMAKGPGNGARNVIAGILKAGFLPTQLADSFAIASGGASFYRNRIKALQKEGLTEAEAEEQAFRDFREIAEESQQSSRPDKISQQQAGPLGRVVLAFANTPAQYARLIKKAASDLKNGRGDAKTNISKIIYYGVAQNLLFSALQQALFALAFDDDEEDKKKDEKYFNIVNGMSDSILRGIGLGGAIVSVVKNTAIRLAKEADKKSPKYQDAVVKGVLQISPPISSKIGKLQSAGRSYSWNKQEMRAKGWAIDNPAYLANANVISALTNVPLDRAVKKITNIVDASNEETEYYKRIALALGWSAWELNIKKEKFKKSVKSTVKSRNRTRSKSRSKKTRN